jgi:hypothetical protein
VNELLAGVQANSLALSLPVPLGLSWTPTRLNATQHRSLEYCENENPRISTSARLSNFDIVVHMIASKAISCDGYKKNLVGIVARIANSDDSISSKAVLLSTLAVSSLFRYGLNNETIKLQGAAIHTLKVSSECQVHGQEPVKHLIAGMLLCSFEVNTPVWKILTCGSLPFAQVHSNSRTAGPWFSYVASAKQLIKAVHVNKKTASSELIHAIGWVYHHDISLQFTLRHWRRKQSTSPKNSSTHDESLESNTTQSMTSIIRNMSDVSCCP